MDAGCGGSGAERREWREQRGRTSTWRDGVSERSGAVAGAGAEWSCGGVPRGREGAERQERRVRTGRDGAGRSGAGAACREIDARR